MKRRRNFLPALILNCIFWLLWFSILFFVSPVSLFSLFIFHFSLLIALFLTFSLLLHNRRRGFLIALGIIVFLILRSLKMANSLNLALLLGILVSLEVYLRKR